MVFLEVLHFFHFCLGGFGIVLKGRHKIYQDFYAIKIIDVTYNSRKCDEIVNEAKKMNLLKVN